VTAPVCRWGILGTANIARKNWKGLRHAGNARITAVASRDVAKAQKFIDECQGEVPFPTVPAACGGYAELLARPDVDAVYVPLPTGIRPEWVIKAAEAGKHVLCEKPCAPTAAELRTMIDACARNGVQFMDGVMFMHSARLPLLRGVLDDGKTVGTVRRVASHFTFSAPPEFLTGNIRASAALEPLGALGDLGWYNVRFSLWALNYAVPEKVSGRLLSDHAGVPLEFSGELLFPGGASAAFYCSFRTELQQWASVGGDKGSVTVPDFVVPYHGSESGFVTDTAYFDVRGTTFLLSSHPRRHAVAEYSEGQPNAQETNMVRTFSDLVLSKKSDPKWGEIALLTQRVLDALVASAKADGALVPVG
jgi:predicted dehydrogenase